MLRTFDVPVCTFYMFTLSYYDPAESNPCSGAPSILTLSSHYVLVSEVGSFFQAFILQYFIYLLSANNSSVAVEILTLSGSCLVRISAGTPTILSEMYAVFPQLYQANAWMLALIDHGSSFQILYKLMLSSWYLTLCILVADSAVKPHKNIVNYYWVYVHFPTLPRCDSPCSCNITLLGYFDGTSTATERARVYSTLGVAPGLTVKEVVVA
jgi:hypothetical protein